MKQYFTVENLHLFTGSVLIIAGLLGYWQDGVHTMLSWMIFGAMYISMSDIGERSMSVTERAAIHHKVRVAFAYTGAILSIWLLITFV